MSADRSKHDNEWGTYTTTPFGDPDKDDFVLSLMGDFRIIDVSKLVPLTFEAKYPDSRGKVDISPFTSVVIEALRADGVDMDDVLDLIMDSSSFCEGQYDCLMSDHAYRKSIEKVYEDLNIDFNEVVVQTFNAFRDEIRELHLPKQIRQELLTSIDGLHVEIGYSRSAEAAWDDNVIALNPGSPILEANYLCDLVRTDISADLVKSLIAGQVAHELAHIVDLMIQGKTLLDRNLSASTTLTHDSSYPVRFDDIQSESARMQMRERFAVYFEYAVVDRMGLSVESVADIKRVYLTMMMNILEHVSPRKLTELVNRAKQKLKGDHPVRLKIESLANRVLGGHPIAQSFPLSRDDVYEALLAIRTPERRLERLGQSIIVQELEEHANQNESGV